MLKHVRCSSVSSSSSCHSAERASISSAPMSFSGFFFLHHFSASWSQLCLSASSSLRLWPSVCLPPISQHPCPFQSDHVPLAFSQESRRRLTQLEPSFDNFLAPKGKEGILGKPWQRGRCCGTARKQSAAVPDTHSPCPMIWRESISGQLRRAPLFQHCYCYIS